MRNGLLRTCIVVTILLAGSSCKTSEPGLTETGETEMTLEVTSPAFEPGGRIPKKYTCDGENVSPPLKWSGVPTETKSLALIVDDPDAPIGTFVHWVLYDLPPDLDSLPEGVRGMGTEGINDFRKTGYGGPCPPRGSEHRYFFKVYALDTTTGLKAGVSKRDLENAMRGHILAQGQLIGIYGR
jgi:hypothetical protein